MNTKANSKTLYIKVAEQPEIDRGKVINALAKYRREWQEAICRQDPFESLVETKGSVALLLADICQLLELTESEKYIVLGGSLTRELENAL